MNNHTRFLVVALSLALCAAGVIFSAGDAANCAVRGGQLTPEIDPETGYRFASASLHKFNFAQLEAVVRADAATRVPNSRVELGSLETEHGLLTMTVVFFGPNHQAQAFLYGLVSEKSSWKITSTRRLWFVPPSQMARGLRV